VKLFSLGLAFLFALPVLAEGGRATGTVRDAEGKPVSGIVLRLVSEEGAPSSAPPVRVEKGRFVFPAFPPGAWRIEIEGGSHAIRRFEIAVRGSEGAKLGSTSVDLPPGSRPPAFSVSGSQRAEIVLVVGSAAAASASEIRAARQTSAKLTHLNELLEKGAFEELLRACDDTLASDPSLTGALYLRAVALWRTGRVGEAAEAIRAAAKADPAQAGIDGVAAAILLDAAAGARGEAPALVAEALACVEPRAATDRTRRAAIRRGAEILTDAGFAEQALATILADPAPDADTALAAYNAAVPLYNAGKMERVRDAMQRIVAAVPDAAPPHRLLGRALLALGEVDAAAREIETFLRLSPDDPEAENERAILKGIR
jgi:tetratricopeptide (TPR) repeat protein